MLAHILYDDGSREQTVRLSPSLVQFGDFEPLDSPEGARRVSLTGARLFGLQFALERRGEEWQVTHLGMVPTWLNGETLEAAKPRPIGIGDVVRVPGIRVDLLEELVPIGELGDKAPPATALAGWQAFQEQIHKSLRDEFELDQQNKHASIANQDVRSAIETRLRSLAELAIDGAPDAVALDLVRVALRRQLTRIASSDQGARVVRASDVVAVASRRIAEILGISSEGSLTEAAVYERIDRIEAGLDAAFDHASYQLSFAERRKIALETVYKNIHDLIFALGPISDLMDLEVVTEIMVARFDRIYIERAGRLEPYPYTFATDEQLVTVIQRMLAPTGRSFNRTSAMVDFQYRDGSRVNAIGDPLAIRGAALTIRKFPRRERPSLAQLAEWSALSFPMAAFLESVVSARKNILISGGTGSGKTTLLNALGRCINKGERVVTIEDTAELDLGDIHVVPLQTRPATVEAQSAVTIRDLVKNALRMRPDRIVVGECRGGEALDMLQAMNTGHSGSMTTAHANSPRDLMLRLETMVMQAEPLPVAAIRQQISAAIDVIVQLNRLPSGARAVTEIAEVIGIDPQTGEMVVEAIYVQRDVGHGGHRFFFTGYLPTFTAEILKAVPADLSVTLFGS